MKATAMQQMDATLPKPRRAPAAILRALERLSARESARGSGIFEKSDEFAGLEALDRAELDETDED
jgi:hypothetical protein